MVGETEKSLAVICSLDVVADVLNQVTTKCKVM